MEDIKEPNVNLSEAILKDIKKQWLAASEAFFNNDMRDWFKHLKGIKLNIFFLLTQEQQEELDKIEQKINKYLGRIKPLGLQYPEKNNDINSNLNSSE